MIEPLSEWETACRLGAAVLAGGVLGWEREFRAKPAGLRTHMMVSLGSAVPVLAALHFLSVAGKSEDLVASDVFRVVQGIMGGIGFLGAGAILQSRHSVHGLTTAATVWVSAAIGVTCAFGYYAQAAIAVGLALIVLFVFGFIEARVIDRSNKPSAEEGSEQMPTR